MSDVASCSLLELLSCESIRDLVACFSAQAKKWVPDGCQLSGLVTASSPDVECLVMGTTTAISLRADDFSHPLAQIIRSGKPAIWMSLNYGARIEHRAFRELVQQQKEECGLYAFPLLNANGRTCGIWALLAPSVVIGDLLKADNPVLSLVQVFQLRVRELSRGDSGAIPVTAMQGEETDPGTVSGECVQALLDVLHSGRPVAITGETGTGKTWLAHYLYQRSLVSTSLISLDCSVLTEDLQGVRLFGADSVAGSALVKAHRGFLLIENIEALAQCWYARFQHFLDSREVISCDGRDSGVAEVRLIITSQQPFITTNCPDKGGRIFYCFTGLEMALSPLRERIHDIKAISSALIQSKPYSSVKTCILTDEVINVLQGYSYPGNIRELENILDGYLFALHTKSMPIAFAELIAKTREIKNKKYDSLPTPESSGSLKKILSRFEDAILRYRLEKYHFDKERTAASLSISRRSLDMKCKKSGIVR